ncbi:unnamed protein product [Rhizophagus irregularis]|nr:unnamed protein product [Rhizophagus irregularis]
MRLNAKLWQSVAKNYAKLLEEEDSCDVSITVGSGDDIKTFNVHSLILRTQTPYFHTAFSAQWGKKKGDKIVLSKPNVTPAIFEDILKFIYSNILWHFLKPDRPKKYISSILPKRHHPYANSKFIKTNYAKITAYKTSYSKYATKPDAFKRVMIGP